MPLKVGLTGGIGSGKTTVARVFELLEVPVYYADAASKSLYNSDPDLMYEMKLHFGDEIYENNILNKKKLSAIVFNDPEKLKLLNKLAHPPTIRNAEEWMKKQTAPYVIKEAALIFESGSSAGLDYVIGVHAPQHIRIKRVMQRDGLSKEDVENRINRQIDETIKMRLCDFVIDNDEQQLIIPQVLQLNERLIDISRSGAY